MNLFQFSAALAALALPLQVSGQTVTVNQTDPGATYSRIDNALNHFTVDPDSDPTTTVIPITVSGVFAVVITIQTPVTIYGPEAKATLELMANPNGFMEYPQYDPDIIRHGEGGIVIDLPAASTTGSVILKNLNIIPSMNINPGTSSTLQTRLRSAIENRNNNLYLELNGVVIAPNEDHAPLVTDPVSSRIFAVFPGDSPTRPEPYNPYVVQFGAHGLILGRTYLPGITEGDGVEVLLHDSVISHFKSHYHPAADEPERFSTNIVMHDAGDPSKARITRIEGKSGVSFASNLLSICGDLNVEGSEENPVHLRASNDYSVRFDGAANNYRQFKNTIITDMSKVGILDRGFGSIRWTMDNCIMFMCLNQVFQVEYATTGTILLTNSTLIGGRNHNGAGSIFNFEASTITNLHLRNSILGGRLDRSIVGTPVPPAPTATTVDRNTIRLAGTNIVTQEGSAILTEGRYAFRASNPFSRGVNSTHPATGTYANSDPVFLVTDINGGGNYPANPSFLDVQNNGYATAGVDNAEPPNAAPLSGGADFVGGVASISGWEIY